MRRTAFVSGLFLMTSSVISAVHAQNQPAPAGAPDPNQSGRVSVSDPSQSGPVNIVRDDQPAPDSGAGLTADYPMDQAGVLIQGGQWTAVANQYPTKTRAAHSIAA